MIRRELCGGSIVFACDTCTQTHFPANTPDFSPAIEAARKAGWRIERSGAHDNWQHTCPDCLAPPAS
jgi:hypothetical protein